MCDCETTITADGTYVYNWTLENGQAILRAVMITVGVHRGTNGPLYYPMEELKRTARAWTGKPVMVNHPNLNGISASANDARIVLDKRIGIIRNSQMQGESLLAELVIDLAKTNRVDGRIVHSIRNRQRLEVSTGLSSEIEQMEGEFRGKPYIGIVKNIQADHLAILPDVRGACGIPECGTFNSDKGTLLMTQQPVQVLKSGSPPVIQQTINQDLQNILNAEQREQQSGGLPDPVIDWNKASDLGQLLRKTP